MPAPATTISDPISTVRSSGTRRKFPTGPARSQQRFVPRHDARCAGGAQSSAVFQRRFRAGGAKDHADVCPLPVRSIAFQSARISSGAIQSCESRSTTHRPLACRKAFQEQPKIGVRLE